jgi:uncharacterized protein DUF5063
LIDGMSDGESLEFTTAAKQYCSVVDRAGQAENTDVWLAEVATALLRASLAVRMLPAPEGQAGAAAAAGPASDQRSAVLARVRDRLGSEAPYQTVWPPAGDHEPCQVTAALAVDLTDIYCDLAKVGSDAAPDGDPVAEWRFCYWNHWGRHAAEALRVIHYSRVGF